MGMVPIMLRMMRLYPRSWWVKYATYSIIIPSALIFQQAGEGLALRKTLVLTAILSMGYCNTFLLNSLADRKGDEHKPGWYAISRKNVIWGKLLASSLLITSITWAFMAFETSTFTVFLALQLSSILYSLGPRFKEMPLGPLVGSMFYWAPVILVYLHLGHVGWPTRLADARSSLWLFLLCTFFLGLEKELSHNLYDFIPDGKAGLRTFGQRAGMDVTRGLVRISKGFFLILVIILGYSLSYPLFALALLFVAFGISGLYRAKYYFVLLAPWLLISKASGITEMILLLGAVPFISRAVAHLLLRLRSGFHRIKGCYAKLNETLHDKHRKAVFSILERT